MKDTQESLLCLLNSCASKKTRNGPTDSPSYRDAWTHLMNSSSLSFHVTGTQERVCLITGTVEGITQVHHFIMEKIMEKPDPSAAPPPPLPPGTSSSSASKEGLPYDRHKQVSTWSGMEEKISFAYCSFIPFGCQCSDELFNSICSSLNPTNKMVHDN